MANDGAKGVALKLTVSNDLNTRLEELANAAHTSPAEILRRAFVLYDVAAQEKVKNHGLGIFDQNKNLITEIVGI